MKKLIVLLAASTMLAGCTEDTRPAAASAVAPPPPPPAAQELADDPAGEAELGTFGFDRTGMDMSVDPGDDFYSYANGVWAANTEIPADKSNYSMFGALDDLSKDRTRKIIMDAAEDPNNRVGAA